MSATPHLQAPAWQRVHLLAGAAAMAAPTVLAYNVSPSPTFLNQALAYFGWGVLVAVVMPQWGFGMSSRSSAQRFRMGAVVPALAVMTITALSAGASTLWGHLPASLSLSALLALAAAAVVMCSGAARRDESQAVVLFGAVAFGAWLAGVFNAAIAVLQVFTPALADGVWLAASGVVGRAVGNLRQPNHLAAVLLCACVATVALCALGRMRARWAAAWVFVFVGAIVLSASRTGAVGLLVLALWGCRDTRMTLSSRRILWAAPAAYALWWLMFWAWAHLTERSLGAATRLAESGLGVSRTAVLQQAWQLIQQHPWFGVGFGEFNFAWTLTPAQQRPPAFFDHTHNLFLQWAVELGLPAAVVLTMVLLWALIVAARRAIAAQGAQGVARRAAWMMVFLVLVHSLIEYPLWYAYFMLPAAWALGFAAAPHSAPDTDAPQQAGYRHTAVAAGAVLCAVSVWSVVDYGRVVAIFKSRSSTLPLAERIERGQASVLFAHHAHYAAATSSSDPATQLPAFAQAAHFLLDARLLKAWAQAWHASGDHDRAAYLASRLREFGHPQSREFFAPCQATPPLSEFPCQAPAHPMTWRDFLPPTGREVHSGVGWQPPLRASEPAASIR